MEKIQNPSLLSGAALAYLGDSVLEVLVRNRLLLSGKRDVGELNEMSREYVTAKKQSEAVERLLPLLDEEEQGIFRRGRNAHSVSIPKSAKAGDYRRATGMEALFGWLWLCGKEQRTEELFLAAYGERE